MRKRKEVQEMLRRLIERSLVVGLLVCLAAAPAASAIWTEEFFTYQRTALRQLTLPDTPIWEEYGFEEAEQAEYAKDDESFRVTAWRFNDSTSAMAVFQWKRPLDYRKSGISQHAVETDDNLYIANGNYIFHFEGRKPSFEELQGLLLVLPRTERSAMPMLIQHLPKDGLIPGSERYVVGPAGLSAFRPDIPLAVASFQFSPEAQLGSYETPQGKVDLAIFSYPTPHIARERLAEFRMLPEAVVKRTGPMLAVTLNPPDPSAAQLLLGGINYRATITWDEMFVEKEWTWYELLITVGILVAVFVGFAILVGLGMAGFREIRRRMVAGTPAEDPMVMLHLED
ncbi:MAG: hypothetical protein GY953_21195 [bacterium]|nr:hypothetical protein [bacterium]